jgi:hypothetical protein
VGSFALPAHVLGLRLRNVLNRVAPRALHRPHARWRLGQAGPLTDHDDRAEDAQQRAERKRLAHGEVLLLADRGCDGPEDQADDNDGPQTHVPHFFLLWIGTSRSGVFDDVDPKLGHRSLATILSLVGFRTLNLAPHGDCVAADHIGEN